MMITFEDEWKDRGFHNIFSGINHFDLMLIKSD